MGDLASSKVQVLGDFAQIANKHGLAHLVIGAGARVLPCELVDLDPGRLTSDWDLAVPFENWAGFHAFVEDLVVVPGAPFQATGVEHRFVHRQTQVLLDLVPFGGIEEQPGRIRWPSGQEMSVQGIDSALLKSDSINLGTVSIRFTSILSQAQQKPAAYMDRRDQGVNHDVIDFVWVLKNYMEAGNQDRVYDEAWETIEAGSIAPNAWGAALLGQDLRSLPPDLLIPVRTTLEELQTPNSCAAQDMRLSQAPDHGERALADIRELARAALRGLNAVLGDEPSTG